MDINPFDQFAGAPQQAPDNNALAPPQFNLAPQQQQQAKPVMNNGGGMYGQQPQFGQQQGGMGMQQGFGQPMGGQGPQSGMGGMGQPMGGQPGQMAPMGAPMGGQPMGGQPGQMGAPQPAPGGPMGGMAPQQSMRGNMLMPSPSINQAGFNNSLTMATPQFGSDASVASGAIVPSNVQSNPYALGPPAAQPAPAIGNGQAPQFGNGQAPPQLGYGQPQQQQPQQNAMVNPFGGQQQPNSFGGQQPQLAMDPFGAPPAPPQQQPPQQQPQQQQAMVAMDPWSSGGSVVPPPQPAAQPAPAMPPAPQIAADPWGGPPQQQSSALVPSSTANDDPFGIFGAPQQQQQPPPQQQYHRESIISTTSSTGPPPPQPAPPAPDDPWSEMGFGSPAPLPDEGDLFDGGIGAAATRAQKEAAANAAAASAAQQQRVEPAPPTHTKGELPPGGEWYDAKIFTPTLGVMFFKPKELVDSLFLQTDKKTVEALDDRPVVAFIVEGSSARSAGVELGHVLLKVNGIDVKNPKEASRLIKEGPRPLPLLFYVPDTTVVVAEGEHMVKYNTKETSAPNSAKDWKPKYVVIGGIIAQPWMMNMYRSKSEYDIAVIETQARRPISVKVKQFSLQGARIQNDWQGPQMVKYKNKLHPWKYIVILPVSRNPIKIASPNLSQLKPVHEGIRRVLNAQQSRSGHSAQPIRNDYDRGGYNGRSGGGGGRY